MAGLSELRNWLRKRLIPGATEGNRRPDGGTSCYRPMQRKNRSEEQQAREQAQAYAAGGQQIPYVHTGFTDMNPPAGGTYVQPGMSGDPYGYGAAQAAQQEYRAAWAAGQEPPAGSNISYMPGAYAPDAGSSFTHVEHILTITSLKSCYEAIECMKNGETLIVTMDTIGQDSESIRCQDMLAGAAFTLGCTVRRLQAGSVVVIAPQSVKILPEVRSASWSDPLGGYGTYAGGADGGVNSPINGYGNAAQPMAVPYDTPRERRVSQNAAGWNQAGGETAWNYNPYTGSMPAAAGDYSRYGGY